MLFYVTIISLLKRWLLATHQGAVKGNHMQACLDEFVFRSGGAFIVKKSEALSFDEFVTHHEPLLCELLELFPVPIHLFRGDGMSIFINSAFKEQSGFHNMSLLAGKFNLLTDPYHNEVLNFSGYIKKVFSGTPIIIEDFRVPLEYMTDFFQINPKNVPEETTYLSARAFPVLDAQVKVMYVIFVFSVKKRYAFEKNLTVAKEAIESQLTGKLDIDLAAQASSMSKTNLIRLFRKHLGMTPHDYWLDLKIEELKGQLQNSTVSIRDAFAACGLDYNSHYSKLFKKKTGFAPLQYKNKNGVIRVTFRHNMAKKPGTLSLDEFVAHHEPLLCDLLELFPLPIHMYEGNGVSAFVNSAFKEVFHIKDASAVVGKFNLLTDSLHKDTLNLRERIQRVFSGHHVLVENVKVPLEYVTDILVANRKHVQNEVMCRSIRGFPVPDAQGGVAYVVLIFDTEKHYGLGQNIAAAKEAIESQLTGKFDIGLAAQVSSMSKTSLTRLFKKHLGMTPHDYWLDLKISRLMAELQNPSGSISDAFAACGLDYNSHYTKLFKEKTGLTPLQYKNRERQRVR